VIAKSAPPSERRHAVRPYRASDLEAVVELFGRSVREVGSRDHSPEQVAAWAPAAPDLAAWAQRLAGGGVFVCEREGSIAGFARVDADGLFDLLYVHPQHQREGIADALWQEVRAWAERRGLRRLRADVSLGARPFFERIGFRLLAEQVVERRGARLRNFRMERELGA
jgi:putative acetyltransferase